MFDERKLRLGFQGEKFVADALSKHQIQNHSTLGSFKTYKETFNNLGEEYERYDHKLEFRGFIIEIETKNPSGDYTISKELVRKHWLAKFKNTNNLQIVVSSHDVISEDSKKKLKENNIKYIIVPFVKGCESNLRDKVLKLILEELPLYFLQDFSKNKRVYSANSLKVNTGPFLISLIIFSSSSVSGFLDFSNYIRGFSSWFSLDSLSLDSLNSKSSTSDLFIIESLGDGVG